MSAAAFACAVGIHIATYHTGHSYSNEQWQTDERGHEIPGTRHRKERDLRPFNPGAWLNCGGLTAGGFNNSIGRLAAYAGWTQPVGSIEITAGWIAGYGKPRPVLIPSMRVGSGLRIAAFPPVRNRAGGIHFMWEF